MRTITRLSLVTALLFFFASCGSRKTDVDATISNIKMKLEKELKQKAENEFAIKKLEAELLRLDTNAAKSAKIKLVNVIPVATQKFEHFIDLQGKVDAENISYISPRGMGGQVKNIYIKQGQFVKKGQLILKLDDAIIRQQIIAAQKSMEVTKTQLDFAKNVYQRQKNLWDQGIGTEVQLLQSKSNVEQLENGLGAAGEGVKTAIEQLNTTNVFSDVSGIADLVNIRVGELFSGMSAQGPQIKIVNTSSLKIVTNVPENYSTRINIGTPVLINIPDAQKENISSAISLISKSVDLTTRGFIAEAILPFNEGFKPNQTAIMRIKDYSVDNAVVIPVNMVQTDETGKYVFVMIRSSSMQGGAKTTAQKVPVIIGEVYGNNVEIKSGLSGGELLITEGYQSLYEGQLIAVQSPL